MRKLITTCLILLLLTDISAQTIITENGINYNTTSNNTVEVTSGGNITGAIAIPTSVSFSGVTYNVTSIGQMAFNYCTGLTSIIIPNSVTTISPMSFTGCSGLTSITLPETLESLPRLFNDTKWYSDQPNGIIYLGKYLYSWKGVMPLNTTIILDPGTICIAERALEGCTGLTSINIPNTVIKIGYSAFLNCKGLTSVTIPNSVTTIGSLTVSSGGGTFQSCTGLTSIVIPNSVISFGNSTFQDCTNLSSIILPSNIKYLGGQVFNNTKWYNDQPEGPVYISNYLCSYKGDMPANTTININAGTTIIAGNAFSNYTNLISISIPNSVTTIGTSAFNGCGLTSITIPNSVTSIGSSMFNNCYNLTSINIPNTVTSIGNSLYILLKLKKIIAPAEIINSIEGGTINSMIWPSSLDTVIVNSGALNQSGLQVLNLSNKTLKYLNLKETTNTELSDESLYNFYSLQSLVLPKNLQKTSYKEYMACVSLKEIMIPSSVTEIGQRSFEDCRSLMTVTFEANSQLKAIDNLAFYSCHALQSITIPNGVTTIGDGAFWGCDYLTNLSLPSSVQSISDNSFDGCISLNTISVQSLVPPTVYINTFNKVNKSIPLVVPDASVSLYKSAFGWKDFYNIKGNSTKVPELEASNYLIKITNRSVEISNASGKSIKTYDILGRKVYETSNAQTTEQFTVNNQGVYIITIDNFRKKIMVY